MAPSWVCRLGQRALATRTLLLPRLGALLPDLTVLVRALLATLVLREAVLLLACLPVDLATAASWRFAAAGTYTTMFWPRLNVARAFVRFH